MDKDFEKWGSIYVSLTNIIKDFSSTCDLTSDNLNESGDRPITKSKAELSNVEISTTVDDCVADVSVPPVNENADNQLFFGNSPLREKKSSEKSPEEIDDGNNDEISLYSQEKGVGTLSIISENGSSPLILQSIHDEELLCVEKINDKGRCTNATQVMLSEQQEIYTENNAFPDNDDSESISSTQSFILHDGKHVPKSELRDTDICQTRNSLKNEEKNDDPDCEIMFCKLEQLDKKDSPSGLKTNFSTSTSKAKEISSDKSPIKRSRCHQYTVPLKTLPLRTAKNTPSIKTPLLFRKSVQQQKTKMPKQTKKKITNQKSELDSNNRTELTLQATYFQRLIIEETKRIAKINQKLTNIQNSVTFIGDTVNIPNVKYTLNKLHTVLERVKANQVQQLVKEPLLSSNPYYMKKASFLQSTITFHQELSAKVCEWGEKKSNTCKVNKRGRKPTNKQLVEKKNQKCRKRSAPRNSTLSPNKNHVKMPRKGIPQLERFSGVPNHHGILSNVQYPLTRKQTPNDEQNVINAMRNAANQPNYYGMFALPSSQANYENTFPLQDHFMNSLESSSFQTATYGPNGMYRNGYQDGYFPTVYNNFPQRNAESVQSPWPIPNTSQAFLNGVEDHTMNGTLSHDTLPLPPGSYCLQRPFSQAFNSYNVPSTHPYFSTITNKQDGETVKHQQHEIQGLQISGRDRAVNATAFLNVPRQLCNSKVHVPLSQDILNAEDIARTIPKSSSNQFNMSLKSPANDKRILNGVYGHNKPMASISQKENLPHPTHMSMKTTNNNYLLNSNAWVPPDVPRIWGNSFGLPASNSIHKGVHNSIYRSSTTTTSIGDRNDGKLSKSGEQSVPEDLSVKKRKKSSSANNIRAFSPVLQTKKVHKHDISLKTKPDLMGKTMDKKKDKFQSSVVTVPTCIKESLAESKDLQQCDVVRFPVANHNNMNKTGDLQLSNPMKKHRKKLPSKTAVSSHKKSGILPCSQDSSKDMYGPNAQVKNLDQTYASVEFHGDLNQRDDDNLEREISEQNEKSEVSVPKTSHIDSDSLPQSYSPYHNCSQSSLSMPDTPSLMVSGEVECHMDNVLKDIKNLPEKTMNDSELPTVVEMIKSGILPFGDNVLSIMAPEGPTCATLDYFGFVVGSDGMIFNTVMEWYQSIPFSPSLGSSLSLGACYEKVLCNGQSLMSLCVAHQSKEKPTINSENFVPGIKRLANEIIPFSYLDYFQYPNIQKLSEMEVLPIGDNEIGPLLPHQLNDIDKW